MHAVKEVLEMKLENRIKRKRERKEKDYSTDPVKLQSLIIAEVKSPPIIIMPDILDPYEKKRRKVMSVRERERRGIGKKKGKPVKLVPFNSALMTLGWSGGK